MSLLIGLTKVIFVFYQPPDEFVDPISCILMCEPVQLPSSQKIVCKSTIAKHLLRYDTSIRNSILVQIVTFILKYCYEYRFKYSFFSLFLPGCILMYDL